MLPFDGESNFHWPACIHQGFKPTMQRMPSIPIIVYLFAGGRTGPTRIGFRTAVAI